MKGFVLRSNTIHPEQARRYAWVAVRRSSQEGPGGIKISRVSADGYYYVFFECDQAADIFETSMDGRNVVYTRIDRLPPNVEVVNISSASVAAAFVAVEAALHEYFGRRDE